MAKKILVANWKLNPTTPREAKQLFTKIKKQTSGLKRSEVVIAPPAIWLSLLDAGQNRQLSLAGQDAFYESAGAFTGRLSSPMFRYAGATHIIIGHSERRLAGDTDDIINKKIKAALKARLKVIFCFGETERDSRGEYLTVLKNQIKTGLQRIGKDNFKHLIMAYEPVWAIGERAREADTPSDFLHNAIFIKKVLAGIVDRKTALAIPILYGGSVNKKNIGDFLGDGEADGVLVGRASLDATEFGAMIKIAEELK
ncbi:MAG: triose-phosphate isomerase [Candidatus Paceibacterota bacterium]